MLIYQTANVTTCKTIWNIQNSLSVRSQQYTNHSFSISNFPHAVKMVNHTKENQRMDDYFRNFAWITDRHIENCLIILHAGDSSTFGGKWKQNLLPFWYRYA